MVKLKEVLCKSCLQRSGIYGVDYSINPYTGCQHGCVYCYARITAKRRGYELEEWGKFVEAKINCAAVLSKELLKARKGLVLLSSTSDPYQPIEVKYKLTRQVLKLLLQHQFPVAILTKSTLVLRDADLFKQFEHCEVGVSISTLDEGACNAFEPNVASIEQRIEVLKKLKDQGIKTYVMIAPILPSFTEYKLEELIKCLAQSTDRLLVDKLNLRNYVWPHVHKVLQSIKPELIKLYQSSLEARCKDVARRIAILCKECGLRCDFCF